RTPSCSVLRSRKYSGPPVLNRSADLAPRSSLKRCQCARLDAAHEGLCRPVARFSKKLPHSGSITKRIRTPPNWMWSEHMIDLGNDRDSAREDIMRGHHPIGVKLTRAGLWPGRLLVPSRLLEFA